MKKLIVLPLILTLVFSGFYAPAQPALPVVTVQFANPYYDCNTHIYRLDVEFKSDVPGQQIFGMNVRFYYDDDVLEFLSMGDFETGYNSPAPSPLPENYGPGSGLAFGLVGPLEFVNGTMQLVSASPVFLNTDTWTRLFRINFQVDDPAALGIASFCPPVIWDLQENPANGGYGPGDEGVVITVVDPSPQVESSATTENVMQFNWIYEASGNVVGHPLEVQCIPTTCGVVIPISNWAIFLAIGLMLIATLFILRKRINN